MRYVMSSLCTQEAVKAGASVDESIWELSTHVFKRVYMDSAFISLQAYKLVE